MDIATIRERLAVLGNRDWPDEWGAYEEETIGDFYGWCHRYRMEEPLPEEAAATFERLSGVQLPADYRQFLTQIGNGGAGPYYGIYPFCEEEEGPLPDEILRDVAKPFALQSTWNGNPPGEAGSRTHFEPDDAYYSFSVMAGALPIATQGCALDYWMVVSGPQAGQIWFDKRTDAEGIEPVLDAEGQIMTFGPWYEAWLDSAYARLASR
ncbi:MAG: hypothetical protein QNJ15_15710 [Erythrobacter sp.]|nr:hypothetical protein [Erythrobacter sp.]